MEIGQSSLYREVQAVIADGKKPIAFSWTCEIHANGNTFQPLKIQEVDILSDYENNYSDEIMLTVNISAGTFAAQIYPFKENIEITVFKKPLQEVGDVPDPSQPSDTERYRATLIDTGNPIIEANTFNTPTQQTLDTSGIMTVSFQLVNKALEQMRMITVGEIFRNCKVGDVIKLLLTRASQSVKGISGARMPKGVDCIEPISNQNVWDHVPIPHGLPLVEVPQYIHEKCRGVYSAGLGYYYQGDYWYIYPCFDTTRFNSAKETLTVINIPKNKFPGIERTYRLNGNNLTVLATGTVKFRDDSETQMLNKGNGVRFADANKFMNDIVTTANNKAVASRGANNSEFLGVKRLTGNNNVKFSPRKITANTYLESSELSRRQGSMVVFEWENSNSNLVFPGMMVKIIYIDQTTIKTIYGVVLSKHAYVHTKGQGMKDTRYIEHTGISIFIQRVETT